MRASASHWRGRGRNRALHGKRGVDRDVQEEHVHSRLPEYTELASRGVCVDDTTHRDGVGAPCARHAHNLQLCVGRRNVRVEARRARGDEIRWAAPRLVPSSTTALSTRSAMSVSASLRSVRPLFEPDDAVASYPLPAADGREWKYSARVNVCPISALPTTLPFTLTSEPFACAGKSVCASPVAKPG